MRRRNCSLTENLEPRLVLSPLSLRGSVDPPRSTPSDSAPQDETPLQVFTRDSQQSQVAQRRFVLGDVNLVPVAEVPVLTPVDPPTTDTIEPGTTPGGAVIDVDDEPGNVAVNDVRTVSSDGGTVDDDLAGDSLSTDDRTLVLVDSVTDADGTRADDESDVEGRVEDIAAGFDSSSESPPASPTEPGVNFLDDSSKNVRVGSGVRGSFEHAEKPMFPIVAYSSAMPGTAADGDAPSWIGALTESVKSWFSFEGLGAGKANTMSDSSVPYVALAGGFSLVAVGRKGLTEADSFEADDPGVGVWKPDRRSGRPADRRRFRWFGFATKDRRSRPSGEVSQEQPSSKQNLSEPDISEAFAMTLMQSVGEDAFVLSPMPSSGELPNDDSEDSSLSFELISVGAATVAGGALAGRSRSSKRQKRVRPTIDYSGTTLPRS
ncbi:MAG: hypothetical protein ISQ06_07265 [Planctomycetaceae bacterium]|nr:hypothetical protein [Planctomycetaceae bacterium]